MENQISPALLDHGLKLFAEMERDRQEACIHCKKVWYSIHYRDGVCHSCHKKNMPGRTAIRRAEEQKATALIVGRDIVILVALLFLSPILAKWFAGLIVLMFVVSYYTGLPYS